MNGNARVYHVRGFTLKYKQALRGIEQCAFAWVEPGRMIRDMTIAESIAARNAQAQLRQELPQSEIPGLRFQPPAKDAALWEERFDLLRQAGQFVSEAIQ